MSFLFKIFANQIIIDAYPSKFTFSIKEKDINISFAPFMYINKERSRWNVIAIGEEIRDELRTDAHLFRVDINDFDKNISTDSVFDREILLQLLFEYGIGKCFERSWIPKLRPIVFILGADRFTKQFENPRDVLDKVLKKSGASIVIFDKTEL